MLPSRHALWLMTAASLLGAGTAGRAQVAATESGRVRGETRDGIASWKGIPFAAAPIGALRWRAPQPAPRWTGVRDATAYGHDCMQLPLPSDAAPLGTPPAEDCLFVNIWRPEGAPAAAKLPVILWIYGGGFVNGGSSPPTYSGAPLARQGVVVVSFNYRVGRFGAFAHPQLTAARADGQRLGTYGYMDQVAALDWVRRNVANFGGDGENITVMGESAGGMSVHALLTSPLARGKVRRAIIMSGGNGEGIGALDMTGMEEVGRNFAAARGIAADDPAALAKLRALPAEQVVDGLNMASMAQQGPRTYAGPFPDGTVAVNARAAYAAGAFTKVPVMVGATDADMGGPTGRMVAGARDVAGLLADAGAPVYAYRFSYVANSVDRPGARHATDIPFFMDTADIKYGAGTTARDRQMGSAISHYVTNFAKTGDPNGAGLPQWPRYARTDDMIMDFTAGGSAVAGRDPLGAALDQAVAAAPAQR